MPRPEASLLFAMAFAALSAAAPALAADEGLTRPDASERLEAVEGRIDAEEAERQRLAEEAAILAQEIETLREQAISLAREAQRHEDALTGLETRLEALTAEEQAGAAALAARRQQSVRLLVALERLAVTPTAALLARPGSSAEAVRGGMLLQAALPRIEEEARRLRQEIAALQALRENIAAERAALAREERALAAKRQRLEALAERKTKLQTTLVARSRDAERRVAALAGEAEDLRGLLAKLRQEAELRRRRLEEQAQKVAALRKPRPFTQGRGKMPLPARGAVIAHYGQPTGVGTTHKGLTIETREGAQVVAPYDGLVVFAGAFRGYGQLLIIEHSEGYHTLLAGVGRIDSFVGQRVAAGEPVGIMLSEDERPTLYVELRRDGQPINPVPWLTAHNSKVSG